MFPLPNLIMAFDLGSIMTFSQINNETQRGMSNLSKCTLCTQLVSKDKNETWVWRPPEPHVNHQPNPQLSSHVLPTGIGGMCGSGV